MSARIARRFGARRVLLTDSGTSALTLALGGAAAVRGDRSAVALPAYGCYDLVTAARGADVEPVLYDLAPGSLSPEPASLREALGSGAGVVVAAHLYGVPVDLDDVAAAAAEAGALIVEDAAQGVGASFRGRPLGSFGSLAVLSFGRGKGRSGGGGGALLAHDETGEEVVEAAGELAPAPGRGARELLVAAAQSALARPALYGLPSALPFLELGETVYRPPRPPRAVAPACLAVLARTWGPSLREADQRRRRAGRVLDAVRRAGDLASVAPPAGGSPGYLRLPVVARQGTARQRLSGPGARRLGVMPGYPEPLHRLAAFREARPRGKTSGAPASLPGAATLAESLFTLPVHSRMSRGDRVRLEERVAPRG
jgi:dTDP-4-amino-4,6-dideoxygalactose transaminase